MNDENYSPYHESEKFQQWWKRQPRDTNLEVTEML